VSVKFIEAPDKKGQAIQTALRALGIIRYGGTLAPDDAKKIIDYLSLCLPMKYRFPRETWVQIEMAVTQTLLEQDDANTV